MRIDVGEITAERLCELPGADLAKLLQGFGEARAEARRRPRIAASLMRCSRISSSPITATASRRSASRWRRTTARSLGADPTTAPTLLIAAAGASAGWRKAALTLSLDGGASWQAIGGTAPAAVIGRAVTRLAPAGSALRDMAHGVDIELLHDAMALAGSDTTGIAASANLALLGDEVIQFATATQIGPRLFRLGGLLRGRRGSEWAMAGHAIGERFVLVDAERLLPWPLPFSTIGQEIRVSASGTGDAEPAEAAIMFQARALRPPSPVGLAVRTMPDGSIAIGWTRRSRAGWDWLDDTDAPLAEEAERYQLTLSRSGGTALAMATDRSSASLSPAQIAAIGGVGPITVSVAQIGTTAASLPPAILTLPSGA